VTREHAPKPGANWDTRIVRAEQLAADEPYGCRHCGHPVDGHGTRYHHRVGLHTWQGSALGVVLADGPWSGPVLARPWTEDGLARPERRPNRRQRRDQQHANRQKGQQR